MEEKMTFKVMDEQGKEREFEVLFTFESEETNKNYIIYTDDTTDDEGNTRVYASTYEKGSNGELVENTSLKPIESEKEWKMIEQILDDIQKQLADEGEENES